MDVEESYFGRFVNIDVADRLIETKLVQHQDWKSLEPALMHGKWFDYRFLNPLEATYLYAHEHRKAFRQAFAKHRDTKVAEHLRLAEDFLTQRPHFVCGIWRGRQIADALGIPYGFYAGRAIKHALNYWQRKFLPQPQQLYSQRIIEAVEKEWEEYQASRLHWARDPVYKNDRYEVALQQGCTFNHDQHHIWLLKQAKLRNNGRGILAWMVYGEKILPERKIVEALGSDMLVTVRDYHAQNPSADSYI